MAARSVPPVCVLGDVDLVRALGLAGISSVVVAGPGDRVRYSRHVVGVLPAVDHWTEGDALVDRLLDWASAQPEPPVLMPQADGDLLLVSRHRRSLAERFRFHVADAAMVEDLLDKSRFQELSERLSLDVPKARRLAAAGDPGQTAELRWPLVVKPLSRRGLAALNFDGKALRVGTLAELRDLWPSIAAAGEDVLVQELVPGPERRMESWHAYVAPDGAVVGEFCGVKLRTWPIEYGHSTAVRVTDVPDVRRAGRDVVSRIGLRGLVKVDFKRDPAGVLRLLEVNPRATLWHHPGAVAGVNLVALLHADLTGRPRPACGSIRREVTWCAVRDDRWAARASGVPTGAWCREVLAARARSGAAWGDPGPFLLGELAPAIGRRWRRATHGMGPASA